MAKWAVISGLVFTLLVVPCFGQMSADEAMEKLRERQAQEAAATTQPDYLLSQIAELKATVSELRTKNDELQSQNIQLRRLVPEAPKAGWNMARIRDAAYARVLPTGDVFNVTVDGKLQPGTAGERVELTSTTAGPPVALANGQTFNSATQQHMRLAQLAAYDVFINNNTPYDPAQDLKTNIKHMTDAYVVLVNVDTGHVDYADRNDDIWGDVFDNEPKQETTLIMQETTTLIITDRPD